MRWDQLPLGMTRTGGTSTRPEFAVTLPTDDDGYLDRTCGECERSFKVRVGTLPADELTCPYCGHLAQIAAFHTAQQAKRAQAAVKQAAVAAIHHELRQMERRLNRNSGGVRFTLSRGRRSLEALPRALGQAARREVACARCGCEAAVYGADAFCAGCGPHSPLQRVLGELRSRRDALDAFKTLPDAERHALEDGGAVDRAREDLLKTAGTVLETYLKDVFKLRVANLAQALHGEPKTAFQQQTRAERLFRDNLGLDLPELVSADRWNRLAGMLARRHVLTHCAGIVDEHYLHHVPNSTARVGQKLVITEAIAHSAADDVEASVMAIDEAINAITEGATSDE